MSYGSIALVKSYYNTHPMTLGLAKSICTTTPMLLDYSRSTNSDVLRRAIVNMFSCLAGHHWG
eukprot:3776121-Karenia_brevis.AAC.1